MTFTCAAAGFFVFACTAPDPVPSAARHCEVAKLFRYSQTDTAESRRQMREANAAYRAAGCATTGK